MKPVRLVIETPTFERQAAEVWSDEERVEFIAWIAANPQAGDVVRGTGGARKVRWAASGRGKRGGARVIYFDYRADEILLLVMMYPKNEQGDVSTQQIERAT